MGNKGSLWNGSSEYARSLQHMYTGVYMKDNPVLYPFQKTWKWRRYKRESPLRRSIRDNRRQQQDLLPELVC